MIREYLSPDMNTTRSIRTRLVGPPGCAAKKDRTLGHQQRSSISTRFHPGLQGTGPDSRQHAITHMKNLSINE